MEDLERVKPKRVVLSGGTGFLGSHVVEELLSRGHEVVLLKRPTSSLWRIEHLLEHPQLVLEESLERAFSRPVDGVIHLATCYRKSHVYRDIPSLIEANLLFATQLADLAAQREVPLWINTGTFFELNFDAHCLSPHTQKKPFNLYAATKLAFEEILQHYPFSHLTFRIFSPYGERDHQEKVIPYILTSALKGEPFRLSWGLQKLDFIYAKDIARAYCLALEKGAVWEKGMTLHLGSGFPVSLRDVVSTVEEILGYPLKVHWNWERREETLVWADISLTEEQLGWRPQFSLREGLTRVIQYMRESENVERT